LVVRVVSLPDRFSSSISMTTKDCSGKSKSATFWVSSGKGGLVIGGFYLVIPLFTIRL
jgi:hypothetical protein